MESNRHDDGRQVTALTLAATGSRHRDSAAIAGLPARWHPAGITCRCTDSARTRIDGKSVLHRPLEPKAGGHPDIAAIRVRSAEEAASALLAEHLTNKVAGA